jgi:hypothetical protein
MLNNVCKSEAMSEEGEITPDEMGDHCLDGA